MKKSILYLFVALNLGLFASFGFAKNAEFKLNLTQNSAQIILAKAESAEFKLNLAQNSGQNALKVAQNAENSGQGVLKTADNVEFKPTISVSVPPQKHLVQKIAANTLKINVIIPSGTDEHNLDFKPATMKGLENSDIYFTIGLEIERVFEDKFKSNFKNLQIIDTGEGLRSLNDTHSHENSSSHENHSENSNLHLNSHENHKHFGENSNKNHENSHTNEHSHENSNKNSHAHEHLHDSKDPHIWFDPILLKAQAAIIAKALSTKYPQHKTLFESNLIKTQNELDALHAELSALLKRAKHKKFIIYHPSLAYFAARYDLMQLSVQIEGKEPKARDLQRLIKTAKKEKIQVILVQKGFSQTATKTLAKELNAKVLEIDNLSEDFGEELLKIARILGD